jgi:hypothetical protein
MAAAGIDGGRRVGGISAGQRARLLAAVAELADRHDRRPEHANPARTLQGTISNSAAALTTRAIVSRHQEIHSRDAAACHLPDTDLGK